MTVIKYESLAQVGDSETKRKLREIYLPSVASVWKYQRFDKLHNNK